MLHFAANFWWLIFPLGGALGGSIRAVAAANERRAERRLERYRLKQQTKIAVAQASGRVRTNEENYRRELAKLIEAHDRTDMQWLDYEVDIAKLLDFPMMTDMRDPLTIAFHKAKRHADLLRPERLEILVVHEEVLYDIQFEGRNVPDVLDVIPAVVAGRNTQHLVVAAVLVDHSEHSHRTRLHQHAGEQRLRQQYKCVQRVAVFTQGVVDEAVVGRVDHRGVQVAIQAHLSRLVVHLVFVSLTLGDLDGDVEFHRLGSFGWGGRCPSAFVECQP